jgi:hypothetical protein
MRSMRYAKAAPLRRSLSCSHDIEDGRLGWSLSPLGHRNLALSLFNRIRTHLRFIAELSLSQSREAGLVQGPYAP